MCVCVCVICRLDGHDGVGPKTSGGKGSRSSESGAASGPLAPILSFEAPPAPHPRTRVLRVAPRDACLALSTDSPLGRVSVGPLSRDRPSPTAFPHPARQQRFFFSLAHVRPARSLRLGAPGRPVRLPGQCPLPTGRRPARKICRCVRVGAERKERKGGRVGRGGVRRRRGGRPNAFAWLCAPRPPGPCPLTERATTCRASGPHCRHARRVCDTARRRGRRPSFHPLPAPPRARLSPQAPAPPTRTPPPSGPTAPPPPPAASTTGRSPSWPGAGTASSASAWRGRTSNWSACPAGMPGRLGTTATTATPFVGRARGGRTGPPLARATRWAFC